MVTTNEIKVYYPRVVPDHSTNCSKFPEVYPTFRCPYPGLATELINVIAKEAGLKIVQVIAEDICAGTSCDFNVYDLTRNRTFDLAATGWQITEQRLQYFDFSHQIYPVETKLIHRLRNDQFSDMFSFFRSYDSKVWLAVMTVWLLQWGCCILSQRFGIYKFGEQPPNVFESAWQILRLQLLQYNESHQQLNASSKFSMSIFSFFQGYVLLGLFSSFILASIIRPKMNKEDPIEFLIDGVSNGKYEFAAMENEIWLLDKIDKSNEYPYLQIREALKGTPLKFANSDEESIEMASTGKTIVFKQSDRYGYYMAMGHCELEALQDDMPVVGAHLMLTKDHPLLPRINKAIKNNLLKFAHIIAKYKKLVDRFDHCNKKGRFKPLKIAPYFGASIVCFGLIGVSIFVLLLEIAFFKLQHNK